MKTSHSPDPYGDRVIRDLTREIRGAGLPFDLQVVEEITSTMNIVAWGRSHGAPPFPGLTLVAKNQTNGRGHSGEWLSSPNDLKVTFLLPTPMSHLVSLAKAGFAWATAEAMRIAAEAKSITQPFDIGIKWPNDVRIANDARTLKVAGIMALIPDHQLADRDTCRRFWWDCPQGFMLLGIGVALTRPSIDHTVSTHLGMKKLSEIATTLDQWTARPVAWNDLLSPLMHKISLVSSLLREDGGDQLARLIARRFALGKDNQVLLEEIGQAPVVATVHGATGAGLTVEYRGKTRILPFDRLVRFTPHGVSGV
jgi:biotin-(acetyl-CoA carboxylase) ligase